METESVERLANPLEAMRLLGQAWRGDWSFFDGRSLRSQLEEIAVMFRAAEAGEPTDLAAFLLLNGICAKCEAWSEYCDCEPA